MCPRRCEIWKRKMELSFFKTFSCADFSVVVVKKGLLGHHQKSSKVSPQINRLSRVLMNLNERGEGILKLCWIFWDVLEIFP